MKGVIKIRAFRERCGLDPEDNRLCLADFWNRGERTFNMSKKTNKVVTRAAVVRAFTSPGRSRRETMDIVSRYVGDFQVPPAWGLGGVRGTFGKAIARAWARKVRHLRVAQYFDPQTQRAITPVVQSIQDLEILHRTRPHARAIDHALESVPQDQSAPFIMDECHQLWTRNRS
mgnify:CR=1 FL=1|jgi:hypothetical protein